MSTKGFECYFSTMQDRAGAGDRSKTSQTPAVMSTAKVTGGGSPDSEKAWTQSGRQKGTVRARRGAVVTGPQQSFLSLGFSIHQMGFK